MLHTINAKNTGSGTSAKLAVCEIASNRTHLAGNYTEQVIAIHPRNPCVTNCYLTTRVIWGTPI